MTNQERGDLLRRVEGLERSRRRWRFLASLAWAALTLALSYQIVSAVGPAREPMPLAILGDGGGSMIEFSTPAAPEAPARMPHANEAPATMPHADEGPGNAPGPGEAR